MLAESIKRKVMLVLSESETVALAKHLLQVKRKHPDHTLKHFVKKFPAREFAGVIHKLLYGHYTTQQASLQRISGRIEEVQQILRDMPRYPPRPYGLHLNNELQRNVQVSRHAWEKFCERFCNVELKPKRVAEAMGASFARARPNKLPKKVELIRIINHDGESAEYFYDDQLNCRFVLARQGKKVIVRTAEVPKLRPKV